MQSLSAPLNPVSGRCPRAVSPPVVLLLCFGRAGEPSSFRLGALLSSPSELCQCPPLVPKTVFTPSSHWGLAQARFFCLVLLPVWPRRFPFLRLVRAMNAVMQRLKLDILGFSHVSLLCT